MQFCKHLLQVIFMLSTIVAVTDCCSSRILLLKKHTLKIVHQYKFQSHLNAALPPQQPELTNSHIMTAPASALIAQDVMLNGNISAIITTTTTTTTPTVTPTNNDDNNNNDSTSTTPIPISMPTTNAYEDSNSSKSVTDELFNTVTATTTIYLPMTTPTLTPTRTSTPTPKLEPTPTTTKMTSKEQPTLMSSTITGTPLLPPNSTVRPLVHNKAATAGTRERHVTGRKFHVFDLYYTIMRDVLSFECSGHFLTDFCLNGGRCFRYPVGNHSFFSCECADGYIGERCESKSFNELYAPPTGFEVKPPPRVRMARIVFSFPMLIAISAVYIFCGAIIVFKLPVKRQKAGGLPGD